MKDKEVLQKAIEIATENGFKSKSFSTGMMWGMWDAMSKYNGYYGDIFSHDFAKAFFPKEDDVKIGSNNQVPRNKGIAFVGITIESYLYHLMEMVRESNPIDYLRKFIDNTENPPLDDNGASYGGIALLNNTESSVVLEPDLGVIKIDHSKLTVEMLEEFNKYLVEEGRNTPLIAMTSLENGYRTTLEILKSQMEDSNKNDRYGLFLTVINNALDQDNTESSVLSESKAKDIILRNEDKDERHD